MDLSFPTLRRSVPSPLPARWLIPPAALLAISGVAMLQGDPAAAAESRFLALLAAAVLATLAAFAAAAGGGTRELLWTALLATAAAWIAYHGPSRGAVVTLILTSGEALAIGRCLRRRLAGGRLGADVAVPAAVGLQLLLRSDLLLPPLLDLRTLVSLLGLPVAAGVAISLLASRFGGPRALVAGAAAVVLAPGWNVTTTLALVALAAGSVVADRERPLAGRGVAAAALALPLVWSPALGALTALAGLALSIRGSRLSAAAALLALVVGATMLPAASWGPASTLWASGAIILPALVLAPADGRWRAFCGLILALFLAQLGQHPETLAAGLALAALGTPAAGMAARLQWTWCGVLLAGTALLAGYPWMRAAPRSELMDLLGLGEGLFALGLLAAACAVLATLLEAAAQRSAALGSAPELTVLLLAGLALTMAAGPATVLLDSYGAVGLDGRRQHWRQRFPEQTVAAVVLDTNLVHGVRLEPGTPVAVVRLRDAERLLESWELRAGDDTAEWAAARADVASRPGFAAPPPWLSRLAPDGSFFARRFRSRLPAPGPRATEVTVHRNNRLPPEVRLVIYRVELRR